MSSRDESTELNTRSAQVSPRQHILKMLPKNRFEGHLKELHKKRELEVARMNYELDSQSNKLARIKKRESYFKQNDFIQQASRFYLKSLEQR